MKKLIISCVLAGAVRSLFAVPMVSDVEMKQTLPNRTVTITYKLQDAPAVVTLDIETNATDGTWRRSVARTSSSCPVRLTARLRPKTLMRTDSARSSGEPTIRGRTI